MTRFFTIVDSKGVPQPKVFDTRSEAVKHRKKNEFVDELVPKFELDACNNRLDNEIDRQERVLDELASVRTEKRELMSQLDACEDKQASLSRVISVYNMIAIILFLALVLYVSLRYLF